MADNTTYVNTVSFQHYISPTSSHFMTRFYSAIKMALSGVEFIQSFIQLWYPGC